MTTTTTTTTTMKTPLGYTETSYAQHWNNTKKQKLNNHKTSRKLHQQQLRQQQLPNNETIFGSVWKDDYLIACTSQGWIYIWHIMNPTNNSTNQEQANTSSPPQNNNHRPLLKFQVFSSEQQQSQQTQQQPQLQSEVVELYGVHYSNGLLFVHGNQGVLVTYQWNDIVQHLSQQQHRQQQQPDDNNHTTTSCCTMVPFTQYHLPSGPGNHNSTTTTIRIMDIDIDESQQHVYAATSNGGYHWNLHTTKLQSMLLYSSSSQLRHRKRTMSSTCCLNSIRVVSSSSSSLLPQDTNSPSTAASYDASLNDKDGTYGSSSKDGSTTTRRVLTGGEDGMLRIWNGGETNHKLMKSIDILKQMKKADSSLIHDSTTTTTTTTTTSTVSNASKCWISSIDVGGTSSSTSDWWIIGGGIVVDTVDRGSASSASSSSSRGNNHGRNQHQKGFVVTIHGPTQSFLHGYITREIPQCILQTNTSEGGLVTVGNECVVSHWSTLPLLQRYSRAWCSPPSVYTVAIRTPTPPGRNDGDYDHDDDEYSMAIGGSGPYMDIFQGPHTKMLTLSIL